MEEFARSVREKRGTIISPLIDSNKSVKIKCRNGHIVLTMPKGFWTCPICPKSKGEETIENILRANNLDFRPEYPVDILIKKKRRRFYFDFLLKKQRLLIEFDGIQHFEDTGFFKIEKDVDVLKNKWAFENDYHLLRIPYWDIDNIKDIIFDSIKLIEEKGSEFLLVSDY